VTPAEVAVVEEGVKRYAPDQHCLVDVRKADIIVYHSKRGNMYITQATCTVQMDT
jgi:hypothetical protein